MDTALRKENLGHKVDNSNLLDHAVRVGLVSYGVVHLLIAWLAVQLAFGDRSGKASSSGALHQLAESGLGRVSLYVVAAGFAALVVWQALEAAVGHRDEDGGKRIWKRVVSGVKVVIYATLGFSALKVATGSSSKGGGTDTWTAKLMSAPAGPVIVALVGVVVVCVGGALVWRGWKEKFRSKLDVDGRTGKDGRAYVLFGKAGYVAKGISLGIVGALFMYAGLTHDPEKSGGLDTALTKLLDQPFGVPLLVVMAIGIACYGLFCFAWARHLDR
jgi:type IV secretory pathway VirB2 component (pilin)